MMRLVRRGPHSCQLNFVGRPGDIWRCEECGRHWKYVAPGNPEYEGWRPAWFRRF